MDAAYFLWYGSALMQWRDSIGAKFVFNPRLGIDAQEIANGIPGIADHARAHRRRADKTHSAKHWRHLRFSGRPKRMLRPVETAKLLDIPSVFSLKARPRRTSMLRILDSPKATVLQVLLAEERHALELVVGDAVDQDRESN